MRLISIVFLSASGEYPHKFYNHSHERYEWKSLSAFPLLHDKNNGGGNLLLQTPWQPMTTQSLFYQSATLFP